MTKYKKFQITLLSDSEHIEQDSDNIIEFIKQLKHTDIMQFDYIDFTDSDELKDFKNEQKYKTLWIKGHKQ